MEFDLLIRRARRWGQGLRGQPAWPEQGIPRGRPDLADLGIRDGRVAAAGDLCGSRAAVELDAEGNLVTPGLVDAHMHWDKAFTLSGSAGASLDQAVTLSPGGGDDEEALARRAETLAWLLVSRGTTLARTHVTVRSGPGGLLALRTLERVRRRLAASIEVQLVAFPALSPGPFTPEERHQVRRLLEEALQAGADALGGAPVRTGDPPAFIDEVLEVARSHGASVDLHVDESDDPRHFCLDYLADRVLALGYQGKVVAGHCSTLSLQELEVRRRVARKVADAGINVVAMPYTNLFLLGRPGCGTAGYRGITAVAELEEAGVNVITASDNIQDAFCPFGTGDMLDVCRLLGVAQRAGGRAEVEALPLKATYRAARALGRADGYGVSVGDQADLVVHSTDDAFDLVVSCPPRRYVIKAGRLLFPPA